MTELLWRATLFYLNQILQRVDMPTAKCGAAALVLLVDVWKNKHGAKFAPFSALAVFRTGFYWHCHRGQVKKTDKQFLAAEYGASLITVNVLVHATLMNINELSITLLVKP